MRIGIDMMGGDFAPDVTVSGSVLARKELPADAEIVLIGDKDLIRETAEKKGLDVSEFDIIDARARVHMGDHPLKAFKEKPGSGLFEGLRMLKRRELDGFCSAGNTGAMMIGAMQIITPIPGIIRPAISTVIPNISGNNSILLDVGLNPDARPDVLYQYGILGSVYSTIVTGIPLPTVSLLNLGSEEDKGNLVVKSTFQLMKDSTDFNFIGNIEGNELFVGNKADVIVCDGFTGNVVLKEAEAFYRLVSMKGICNGYFEMFNFENFGGTVILGVQAPVVIGHGVSTEKAIKQMILHTLEVAGAGMIQTIKDALDK
ncbi:MAG: phosphate acyltransferase [Bacteroidota bacterium]